MKISAIFLHLSAIIIFPLQGCEKNDENKLFELSSYVLKGQDGYEYVLTKNEFLTPYDFPIKELRIEYGNESGLADWTDLKANFEDDFFGFLNQIGLTDYEKHHSFFITKDGEYEHMTDRYYMLTGKNNPYSSASIILNNMDVSRLILTAGYDKGRILLKIPAEK
jgi:hypothetical protein